MSYDILVLLNSLHPHNPICLKINLKSVAHANIYRYTYIRKRNLDMALGRPVKQRHAEQGNCSHLINLSFSIYYVYIIS